MDLSKLLCTVFAFADDTPIGLYIAVGVIALVLVIAAIVLGAKSKKK